MRLVDADLLITTLGKMMPVPLTPDFSTNIDQDIHLICETLADVIETVNEQPTINNWIPCCEKLPEEYKDVIVHLKVNNKKDLVTLMRRLPEDTTNNDIWSWTLLDTHYTVIAWQELPKV